MVKGHPPIQGAGRPKSLKTSLEARFGPNAADAWEVLERIMHGKLETVEERLLPSGKIIEVVRRPTIAERKEAAETIIAYTEGKPAQQVRIDTNVNVKTMPDQALEERVVGILTRFAEARVRERELADEPTAVPMLPPKPAK